MEVATHIAAMGRPQRISNCSQGLAGASTSPLEMPSGAAAESPARNGKSGRQTSAIKPENQMAKRCAAEMRGATRKQIVRANATAAPCQRAGQPAEPQLERKHGIRVR